MKIINNVIIITFLVANFFGCQEQNSIDSVYGKSSFVPIRDLTSGENLQITLLDFGIDLFHSDVIFYAGNIIISSRGGRLLSITMDGDVNWFLERQGRGPGEFYDPHDMQIDDDIIGVLSTDNAKVSLFTIDGQFYKDIQLRSSADQFGIVDGEIHIFHPYNNDYLFARYDIETGEESMYGDRNLINFLPEKVSPQNFMFYSNILQTDDRYTVVGLVHYAQILIYDRILDTGKVMDLSGEMEIAESIKNHRNSEINAPPGAHITYHFLDLVKIGDYFGVMIPGPWDKNYADFYRISPDGRIHDRVYKAMDGKFKVPVMQNLTLLNDGTYFGHINSQDKLVIVDIVDQENSSE